MVSDTNGHRMGDELLATPGFVTGVADVLAETCTPPAEVTLEITESAFVHDVEHVRRVLSDLKQLGVMIALDDFGTGCSSLASLDGARSDRSRWS